MSELSEAMLGVTGVIRPKPDGETVAKADELLAEFRARARRWVGATSLRPWSPPPTQGFSRPELLRERLLVTPDEPEGVHDLGDDAIEAEWTSELVDAREQLSAAWPAVVLRSGIEPEDVPLSFDRAQDWLALVAVIEDPFRMLFELESGAVTPAQLDLFESVYPDLHAILVGETATGVAELLAKRRELPVAKDRAVRLVLKRPPDEPILVPQPEEPPPPKPSKADTQDTRTVAQKAAT